MFGWLRELLDIRYEFRERHTNLKTVNEKNSQICDSCETLKTQLEIAHANNRLLMGKLLKEDEPVISGTVEGPKITVPKTIPWRQRQQMLEAEDRAKAAALRNAAQPVQNDVEGIKEFEEELKNAERERESKH